MSITKDFFVACSYELYAGPNEVRDFIEQATPESPMQYMHGIGMMLSAFEQKLDGLKEGDSFDFELTPENGYGERFSDRVVPLDRKIFCVEDGKFDEEHVFMGARVPMQTVDGQRIEGQVIEMNDEKITLDFNHPLSGMYLHFTGKILEAHPATDEERAEIEALLQPHGNSCGFGCGCHDDAEESGCEGGCCGGCH